MLSSSPSTSAVRAGVAPSTTRQVDHHVGRGTAGSRRRQPGTDLEVARRVTLLRPACARPGRAGFAHRARRQRPLGRSRAGGLHRIGARSLLLCRLARQPHRGREAAEAAASSAARPSTGRAPPRRQRARLVCGMPVLGRSATAGTIATGCRRSAGDRRSTATAGDGSPDASRSLTRRSSGAEIIRGLNHRPIVAPRRPAGHVARGAQTMRIMPLRGLQQPRRRRCSKARRSFVSPCAPRRAPRPRYR